MEGSKVDNFRWVWLVVTIGSSSLFSTNIFIGGVKDWNWWPKKYLHQYISFNVKEDGSVTGSQVLFDGGKVGGWNINANQLSANNIKINAAVGYIEAGDLNNVSDYQDSSTGFFVNKDGEILLKAGTSANKNYMRFADGTLDIRTNDFELDTNNLELSYRRVWVLEKLKLFYRFNHINNF